jgi:hypothetical protein
MKWTLHETFARLLAALEPILAAQPGRAAHAARSRLASLLPGGAGALLKSSAQHGDKEERLPARERS